MPSAHIVKKTIIKDTPRLLQLKGIFDLNIDKQQQEWEINLPIEGINWNIGLIVGRSGSGKTTIAKQLFGDNIIDNYEWFEDKSIVDSFPSTLSIKEITQLLSSVGFSSPPNWVVPFKYLSNGEQFRVTIARAMAENKQLTVIDEFTSVVDRTVAKISSTAVAKAFRKRNRQLIAVSCHYDIIDWLSPDWIYDLNTNEFQKKTRLVRQLVLKSHPSIKVLGNYLGNITI